MKVYITDLEAYNSGHIVGEWYQLPMDKQLLDVMVQELLRAGRIACGDEHYHDEYFITDYECDYMEIEEYTCLEKLNEITEAMEGIDADGQKAIKFLLDNNFVNGIFEAIASYEDCVRIYEDSTMEDIAENYIEECYNLDDMPSIIANNIDYESIASDMEIEGSFYRINGDIYEYIG